MMIVTPNKVETEPLDSSTLRAKGIRKGRVLMRWFGIHDKAASDLLLTLPEAQAVARERWEKEHGKGGILVDATFVQVHREFDRADYQMGMTFMTFKGDADGTPIVRLHEVIETFKTRKITPSA